MSARVIPYALPFRTPVRTALGTSVERTGALVALTGDDGTMGWGDAAPLDGWSDETLADVLVNLHGWADGRVQWAELPPTAAAALDSARVDLRARRLGLRAADLLAAPEEPRDHVEVSGLVGADEPDEVAKQVHHFVDAGYDVIKLKVAAGSPDEDVERVRIAREVGGPSIDLRLDANGGWTADEAEHVLRAVADQAIAYVEEPVTDLDDLARLRRVLPLSIAVDERVRTPADLDAVLAARAADVAVLKPASLGGPTVARRMAARARSAGLDVVITSFLDCAVGLTHALHVAASLPDALPSGLSTGTLFARDVVASPPVIDGRMALPDGHGLGVVPGSPRTLPGSDQVAAELAQGGAGEGVDPLDGPGGREGWELRSDVITDFVESGP